MGKRGKSTNTSFNNSVYSEETITENDIRQLGRDLAELEVTVVKLESRLKKKILEKKYKKADQIRNQLRELKIFFMDKKRDVLELEHERAVIIYFKRFRAI